MATPLLNPLLGARLLAHPINRGCVGCWLMNEEGGQNVNDIAMANFATANANPTWASGQYGSALKLDGSTQYVNVPAATNLATASMSYSAWIYGTAFSNAYSAIVHRGSAITFFEYYVKSTGKLAVYSSGSNYDPGNVTLSTGKWYHVVAVYDNAATVVRGYVNGVLDATGNVSAATLTSLTGVLSIGRDSQTAGRFFAGYINNVRVYNRALSAQEIRQLYEQPFIGIGPRPQRIYANSAAFQAYWATRNNQIFDGMVT